MERKYAVIGSVVLLVLYQLYTSSILDVVFYLLFIVIGVYLGQELEQIPKISKAVDYKKL